MCPFDRWTPFFYYFAPLHMHVSLISRWGLKEFEKPLILTATSLQRCHEQTLTKISVHSFEPTNLKFDHITIIIGNRKINRIKEKTKHAVGFFFKNSLFVSINWLASIGLLVLVLFTIFV